MWKHNRTFTRVEETARWLLAVLLLLLLLLLCGTALAGTKYYYYTDPQGTPLAKADSQGNIVERYEYTPYGVPLPGLGVSPNGLGYTGHVSDPETGLVYMQHRYYDPTMGRFLSVDPLTVVESPAVAFNRYWYANNNPYRFTDPDGRQSVGEMIDSGAQGCGSASCAGWALANAAWKVFGAEGVSQIADKGWSNTGGGDKAGATLEVAAVLPPVKLLRGVEVVAKEVLPAIKAGSAGGETAGKVFSEAIKGAARTENPGAVCVYCRMEGTATQVDHAIPKARGGIATLDNAQLACPHCNASKGVRDSPVNPPPGYRGEWPPSHWDRKL